MCNASLNWPCTKTPVCTGVVQKIASIQDEEWAGASRHEPSEAELKNANELELEVELERQLRSRSSGGFVRPG
jgi:hypothetical protein